MSIINNKEYHSEREKKKENIVKVSIIENNYYSDFLLNTQINYQEMNLEF